MNICWPKGCVGLHPNHKLSGGLSRWMSAASLMGVEVSEGIFALQAPQNTIRLPCSRTETITLLSNFMNDLQSHRAFTVKAKVATGSLVWISYSLQLVGLSTLIWGLQLVDVNLTGCHCQIQVPGLPDLPTLSVVGKHMRTGMQSTLVKP